ncbi:MULTISPECIES: sigma factor G inhibitor Gin [Paenibacillus]|uniref:Inhibitor of sigma-G Gin n=1 Tax=Paenibacillus lutrae TaxID=2078573 RepID=A0A7X3K1E0_9BACL|nr:MULTISPECIES: sigma factor G inhibitor Gin [Paenibacillus]MVP02153.1 inhibitor of sigma-G Gin [Paenibacillus lutrae]
MEESVQPKCIVCGETKQEGIQIVSEFICEACESEIVHTDVLDVKYSFFIRQLKQIFYKKNA